jgi:hypothetical protein
MVAGTGLSVPAGTSATPASLRRTRTQATCRTSSPFRVSGVPAGTSLEHLLPARLRVGRQFTFSTAQMTRHDPARVVN